MYLQTCRTFNSKIVTTNFSSDVNMCPVQTWKLYTSKLNKASNYLWQKPRQGYVAYVDEEWFEQRIVGRDMLERFVKLSLSKSVKLDGNYTNHSIRARVISTLENAGFEGRHIITLSSHKHEASIKEYTTACPESKKKEMFQSLTNALLPKSSNAIIAPKSNPTATVSKPPDISDILDVKANLPTFNLQPIEDFSTIDDDILANLVYDISTENDTNQTNDKDDQNKTVALASTNNVPQVNPQQIAPQTVQTNQSSQYHTQVNTFNNPPNTRLPQMYFPHSNVTINYNFGK